MLIIKQADEKIEKILGSQRINEASYRLSTLVIQDGDLFHNTLTGELIRVSEKDQNELIRKKYYLPENANEISICKQLRDIVYLLAPQTVSSLVILPTSCCNARCFYCYEAGIVKQTMTEEIVKKVIEYIRTNVKEKMNIQWFGGEPLVGIDEIDKICSGISDIDFNSKMISNGFLFNSEVITRAKQLWHLEEVQITLDGTEKVYNKTKNYYDTSQNPFKRVMNNIQLLIDAEIKVDLRMNVGKHNSDDLVELINQLEVFKGEYFRPYVHTIFEETSEEMDIKCEELNSLLVEKGMKKPGRELCKLKTNRCMADNDCSFVINPDGGISKCEHFACDKLVGSIDDGIDKSKLEPWKKYSIPPICEDCPLLPSCILLDECPNAQPCSPFEKANRIEKTKITMRELARKYDEEHSK